MDLPKRKQIRLSGYDYSKNGLYFITICTQNRKCIFGDIVNNKMVLNNIGNIINNVLETLPNRFPIILDEYQIMPNHLHLIITIDNPVVVGAGFPRPINGPELSHPTLGKIIGYFKYQTTKQINIYSGRETRNPLDSGRETRPLQKMTLPKIWQRNYYEHIIRNDSELLKIQEYIETNPQMWERDKNN